MCKIYIYIIYIIYIYINYHLYRQSLNDYFSQKNHQNIEVILTVQSNLIL